MNTPAEASRPHLIAVADLSGWVSKESRGTERITSAAVAIDSRIADDLRTSVAGRFGKWRSSNSEDVADMVSLICDCAAGVAIQSIVKAEPAWGTFWNDAVPLLNAIVAEDRKAAGFAKPANIVTFMLFNTALMRSLAIAIASGRFNYEQSDGVFRVFERAIVCDSDIQGAENIATFEGMWRHFDAYHPRVASTGTRLITRSVSVTTEEAEPLLLLADFAAGIGQCAFSEDASDKSFPIDRKTAQLAIDRLNSCGAAGVTSEPFGLNYASIFGDTYRIAEARAKK